MMLKYRLLLLVLLANLFVVTAVIPPGLRFPARNLCDRIGIPLKARPLDPASIVPPGGKHSTLIFCNGHIITMDEEQPVAAALAIRNNVIQAVGANDEILSLRRRRGTMIINLKGLTVMPGFIEGHSHILRGHATGGVTLDQAMDTALSYGITTVNELTADEAFIHELMTVEAAGDLRLRVNLFPQYNEAFLDEATGDTILVQAWYPHSAPRLDANHLLRIVGVKFFVDGAFSPGRGCPALTDPYPADFRATPEFQAICFDDLRGDAYVDQATLNTAVADIHSRGYRAAFHAMGDRGIDMALDAIAFALDGESNETYRHQIHHNSLLRPDQLQRFAEMDVLGSVRGYWNTCDQEWYAYWYGPERRDWATNRFALITTGLHAFAEGDFGWTTPPDDRTSPRPINPFLTIYGLVTHRQLQAGGTACEPEPWVAQHVISVEAALRATTIEAAYAVSQEDVIGSLERSKFADLIILPANPLTVDPDALADIRPLLTMVNGKVLWCSARLCRGAGR